MIFLPQALRKSRKAVTTLILDLSQLTCNVEISLQVCLDQELEMFDLKLRYCHKSFERVRLTREPRKKVPVNVHKPDVAVMGVTCW